MRVVFDGAALGLGPITGVGRAFLNALAAYSSLVEAPVWLLLPPGAGDPGFAGVTAVPAPRGALRRQLLLPRLLRQLQADVLHSPVAAVPLRAPCATIATVHDLPWLCPESGERTPAWPRFAARTALRSATAVLAPSQFTLAAARRLLHGTAVRLLYVPHGVALPDAAPPAETRNGPLLVLGDDRPRKNRARVLQAHAQALAACPTLPPLQFVGPPDRYVDEFDKARLLQHCRALVQCSLFEGFGMPLLEGLGHGAPVLAADIAPFREIAGDAALFVDPRDVAAIAAGLLRIHGDAALRQHGADTGRRRAQALQPQHTAEQWLLLHRELTR